MEKRFELKFELKYLFAREFGVWNFKRRVIVNKGHVGLQCRFFFQSTIQLNSRLRVA